MNDEKYYLNPDMRKYFPTGYSYYDYVMNHTYFLTPSPFTKGHVVLFPTGQGAMEYIDNEFKKYLKTPVYELYKYRIYNLIAKYREDHKEYTIDCSTVRMIHPLGLFDEGRNHRRYSHELIDKLNKECDEYIKKHGIRFVGEPE